MTTEVTIVYLGLGSNVGDRKRHLTGALERLAPQLQIEAISSLYETDPVGPQDQQDFYNAVCRASTRLTPNELLEHVKQIERDIGRLERERWGPREIDIDILLYGDQVVESPELHIPHPEMNDRAFVLVPLAELAADVHHPDGGRTVAELAADVDAGGVRLIEEPGWEKPRS